ncbi:hypothetical protein KY285_014441 [Solanum tuberosum]|nr:hypothetical protein KY285_014441 [Solanum tuberosum]
MADQDQFSDLDILPSMKSRELEFIGINACCPGDNGRSRSRILHWIAVPVTIPIKTLNPKSILEFPMIPTAPVNLSVACTKGSDREVIGEVKKVIDEKFINRGLVVSVVIGIGTCYIKVDDNGSGVPQNGLVLMGERYVYRIACITQLIGCLTVCVSTSKYCHSDDMHAFPTSFGLKGEALSCTSDVSLLKIVTKTHGKILTGKRLHFGIDDCRQDVGTTCSSFEGSKCTPIWNPKVGVLHSLKESLLRIVLVHPNVSCNFVDIESEDDLLCTRVSPPPLPLLSSDINSRFVSKGPRHKLLNKIAMTFGSASYYEQRSQSQIYPLVLLNLNFPRSLYDLTLEPSMNSVEFKVSVAIGIGTCYIKVDDNALHQRHQNTAISDDMHAFPASFGFKGEALSSISDVYLLELLPKLMRGQMDIDGKGFCTLELMSVDKMIVQHMTCFADVLLLLLAAVVQWVWDSSEFP